MERFKTRYNRHIKERRIHRFATQLSIENFNEYLRHTQTGRDFSLSLFDAFQDNVDFFVAKYLDVDDGEQEVLLNQVTFGLSPWQKGKFVGLLYLYGHGFERSSWLPQLATELYDTLSSSKEKRSFNRALRTTDKNNISVHRDGPIFTIERFYSPVVKHLSSRFVPDDSL